MCYHRYECYHCVNTLDHTLNTNEHVNLNLVSRNQTSQPLITLRLGYIVPPLLIGKIVVLALLKVQKTTLNMVCSVTWY